MRSFLLVGLLLAAVPVAAQDARLVLRAAYLPDPLGLNRFVPDTTAMERSTLDGEPIYLGEVLLDWSEAAFTSVSVDSDPFTGAPELSLVLADAEAFRVVTEAQVGKPIAIVYDGRVLTAPTVNGTIPNGRVQISGRFSRDEVEELAARLRDVSGAQDGRAMAVQVLRATADWSTPEAALTTFLRAAELRDWPTFVPGFHPATLQSIREEAERSLVVQGDALSSQLAALFAPPAPPRAVGDDPTDEPVGATPQTWSIARLLEAPAPGTDWADFSDEQVAILYLSVVSTPDPSLPPLVQLNVEGTIQRGEDTAFVVVTRRDTTWASESDSSARVFELRRLDARWHVLLPAGGW